MMNKYTLRERFKQLFTGDRRMETIVENGGDSIGYLGLTQSTGRIIVIDQASRFRAMRKQFLLLQEEENAIERQESLDEPPQDVQ